jgi:hypothetical protein
MTEDYDQIRVLPDDALVRTTIIQLPAEQRADPLSSDGHDTVRARQMGFGDVAGV